MSGMLESGGGLGQLTLNRIEEDTRRLRFGLRKKPTPALGDGKSIIPKEVVCYNYS